MIRGSPSCSALAVHFGLRRCLVGRIGSRLRTIVPIFLGQRLRRTAPAPRGCRAPLPAGSSPTTLTGRVGYCARWHHRSNDANTTAAMAIFSNFIPYLPYPATLASKLLPEPEGWRHVALFPLAFGTTLPHPIDKAWHSKYAGVVNRPDARQGDRPIDDVVSKLKKRPPRAVSAPSWTHRRLPGDNDVHYDGRDPPVGHHPPGGTICACPISSSRAVRATTAHDSIDYPSHSG